jgi:Tol biopolymer transport system component
VRVRVFAPSSAFLMLTELAGLLATAGTEPVGLVSRCAESPPNQVVETTRAGYEPLDEQSIVWPVVLPSNLEADGEFRPFLDRMWQLSPTFRRQCHSLAAGTGLRVSVLVEDRPGRASFNARTVFTRQAGSLVWARVYLKPSLDASEHIAHEFEHILEQLDGVDLQAQAGNGSVWKGGDGAFETGRAVEAGRRVAREIMRGSDVSDRARPLEHEADRLTTVVQQDRNAAPSSVRSARVSGSGRFVVFVSSARLVDADRNQLGDVYVLDLATGQCTLESVAPGGSAGDGESLSPDISKDGRYVTFASAAGNLTDRQFSPDAFQVFLRDRQEGTTRLVTANAENEPANGTSGRPAINADATALVFESTATDLISTHEIDRRSVGIYLIQLASGQRTRLDLTSAGGRGAGQSMSPAISGDGRFVAFVSRADFTCTEAQACVTEPSDTNGVADIYLRDTLTNITRRITGSYAGGDPDGPSYDPVISSDGQHVAFVSEAQNLTRDSRSRAAHIYVHDLVTGITELVSRTPGGRPANGASLRPAISHDGGTVAFQSLASNLVCEGRCREKKLDNNLLWDVFVYQRFTRRTIRVTHDDGEWMGNSRAPSLDDTGRVLAFGSRHPMNGRDEADDEDLFVYRVRSGFD